MRDYTVKTLSDYQKQLEHFEKVNDISVLPDMHIVVRLDGKRFGSSWNEINQAAYPYDPKIFEAFQYTAKVLMSSGVRVLYASTHGDEISLLLDKTESANPRKRSNLLTYLSSVASVYFTQTYGLPIIFQAKLSELPTPRHVVDYFFWQRKVYRRNYLSRLLATALSQTMTRDEIQKKISGMLEEERIAFVREIGVNYEEIPSHYLFGYGIWWEQSNLLGIDTSDEFSLVGTLELPQDDHDYLDFIEHRVFGNSYLVSQNINQDEIFVTDIPPEKTIAKPLVRNNTRRNNNREERSYKNSSHKNHSGNNRNYQQKKKYKKDSHVKDTHKAEGTDLKNKNQEKQQRDIAENLKGNTTEILIKS